MYVIFLPNMERICLIFLKAFLSPPTITDNSPDMAPFSPPDTGASIKKAFFIFKALLISFVASGEMVLMSITHEPFFKLESNPFFPITTDFTSFVLGKLVIIVSA